MEMHKSGRHGLDFAYSSEVIRFVLNIFACAFYADLRSSKG